MSPFFFFGTLMDPEVLEIALDREVAMTELVPGSLTGFRRARLTLAVYPTLVAAPESALEGRLLFGASGRDEARLRYFEHGYVERWLTVRRLDHGRVVPARTFFASWRLGASAQSWSLEAWARRHKARYVPLCRQWMATCPV